MNDGDPTPIIVILKVMSGVRIDASDPMHERLQAVVQFPGVDLDDLDDSEPPFFTYLPEVVAHTSDEDFCAARDELRELLRLADPVAEKIGDRLHPLAARVALSYREDFDPFMCKLLVITWAGFRQVEHGREQYTRARDWLVTTNALTERPQLSTEERSDARHSR